MPAKRTTLFTSESVTEGHPDKICDQISDAILDAIIRQDPEAHVACETLVSTGLVMIAGEIKTMDSCTVDYPEVARGVIERIGYNNSSYGFDHFSCGVITSIGKQSPDIERGVRRRKAEEQGAGDQGMMFGYACDETAELMPMPIMLAHRLVMRLAKARKKGEIKWLRPDGKSQVTVEYENGEPKRVHTIVVAAQHDPEVNMKTIRETIINEVVRKVIPQKMLDDKVVYHINRTGRFVKGGPSGDTGVTGRKIIVDTYGGIGRHGGGCFSGKDPSKVDRSASYAARWVAKNIVAAKIARRCEVQIAYVIGHAKPVSLYVNTFGTGKHEDTKIAKAVRQVFDLRPRKIIERLDLLRPIYEKTAAYGHFGRKEAGFSWEKTDMVDALKEEIK
jgi:S-adenosylmethionine synthetase